MTCVPFECSPRGLAKRALAFRPSRKPETGAPAACLTLHTAALEGDGVKVGVLERVGEAEGDRDGVAEIINGVRELDGVNDGDAPIDKEAVGVFVGDADAEGVGVDDTMQARNITIPSLPAPVSSGSNRVVLKADT